MTLPANTTANDYIRAWLAGDLTPLVDASGTASATGTPTHVADQTVTVAATIRAAAVTRKEITVQNVGIPGTDGNARVTFDGSVPSATNGFQLVPGASITRTGNTCPTGAVKAIKEGSAAAKLSVEEIA